MTSWREDLKEQWGSSGTRVYHGVCEIVIGKRILNNSVGFVYYYYYYYHRNLPFP